MRDYESAVALNRMFGHDRYASVTFRNVEINEDSS